MKYVKATAVFVVLVFLLIILTSACTRKDKTGYVVKDAGKDLGKGSGFETQQAQQNAQQNSYGSGGDEEESGQEAEEVCTVEAGILNKIFSGHGSL